MYEFIVEEYEFIYAGIWIHIHYEFIYLWIHIINYEFIVDTMNSYLPRIQMQMADSLLDSTSYGARWVLLSPAPAAGVVAGSRARRPPGRPSG